MVAIAQYFAKVAIDVDQSSLKKVDDYFKSLDTKMQRYKGRLGNGLKIKVTVDIDTRSTMLNLRRKLDTIGQGLILTVKRIQFAVNGKQIRSQAEQQLSAGIRVRVLPFIRQTNVMDLRRQLVGGLQNIPVSVRYRGNFKESLMNRINAALTPARPAGRGAGGSRSGSRGGGGRSGYDFPANLMMGPTGRLLRMGTNAVPFVGGAVGLGALNKANTDYQSQKIAAQGVFENYGGGDAAREQLFNLAQQRGVDYKATLPQFTQFMASAMPALGYKTSFKTFQGFLEFGRARGATADSMERALYAVSQMAGKGKVTSEELNQQLGDAAGFGEMKGIFAEAWAKKTKSGATGQKAIADLVEAMKKGNVSSADILPIVAQIASGRVSGVIDKASQSADANQNRFNNARQAFMARFSESGGEAALAKMWETLTDVMGKMGDRAPMLVSAFTDLIDKFAKFTDIVMDLSSVIGTGVGNKTTIAVDNATGINLVGIRNAIASLTEWLTRLTDKIGFTFTVLGGVITYFLAKTGLKYLQNKAGGAIGEATGGSLGSLSMANFMQATKMGQALRVWVVNSTNQQGGVTSSSESPKDRAKETVKTLKKNPWVIGSAMALPAFLGGILSYLHPNQNSPTVQMPADLMSGAAAMEHIAYLQGGADKFTKANISQAAPVVEQAKTGQYNVTQDFILKADIKITAENGADAFNSFQKQLNEELFTNMFQNNLRASQATYADFVR